MLQTRRRRMSGVVLGALLAVALHLLQWPLKHLIYAGLTQWLYLAPAAWLAGRRGRPDIRLGLLLVGGATLAVNAIAYGVVYYLFFVPHGTAP